MRAAIVMVLVLAAARSATADVTTVCYAGTTSITVGTSTVGTSTTKNAFVIERTSDPDASEIRQRGWSTHDPQKEITTRLLVDAKAGTFKVVDAPQGATGSGTLKGKPWKWTASHATLSVHLGSSDMVSTGDSTYAAKKMTMKQVLKNGTETVATETSEATIFDCKQLDAKRAALSKLAATAEHRCYEGVARRKNANGTNDEAVIVQQTADDKHIEIRQQLASMKGERFVVFTIDGSNISVEDPMVPNANGSGTLNGKAGAWTGYTWKRHDKRWKIDVEATGTLGGDRYMAITSGAGRGVTTTTTIDATSFDCGKLSERKAALESAAPAR